MKSKKTKISPQYIIDKNGKKTGVFLKISEFNTLMHVLEDQYDGKLAEKALKEDTFTDFEIVKKKLLKK